MPSMLTAKEQPLFKIFCNDYKFSIPHYQRPYSWGVAQARELLSDLRGALEDAPAQIAEANPYFLGSIVLIKKEGLSDAEVVDGQQRLTTLTLLMSAIRASIEDVNLQNGITSLLYAKADFLTGVSASYRLNLRARDRDFFRDHVQHENALPNLLAIKSVLKDAQKRLQENAQALMEGLAGMSQADLARLAQFITTRCYLVVVSTPDLDSAFRIFGVMNSRGLDLTATDILKAEILSALDSRDEVAYSNIWETLEADMGQDEFGTLFGHIRMIYRKAKPQGTLLKEFKEHVLKQMTAEEFMVEVLQPMAKAFDCIMNADYASTQYAEQINERLRWLNKLEFKDWVPPALAFFVRYEQEPEALLQFLTDLERLAYSMLVRKFWVNERMDRFSKLTAFIEQAGNLKSEDSPLQLSVHEQRHCYDVLQGPLYDSHSARALSILLLRLDSLLSDGSVVYEHGKLTVEHVLPQNPPHDSSWAPWLESRETHQHWVHRLGNLALLNRQKNSAASNYSFEKKKAAYFAKGGVCTFAITTQVLQHSDWTEAVIKVRQDEMLRALELHWRLGGRSSAA
ncbi:DUF262 domain-containing protein [Comamonas sp. MYb396]